MKCPQTEIFLVRVFPHSDWIRTRNNSVFGHFSRSDRTQVESSCLAHKKDLIKAIKRVTKTITWERKKMFKFNFSKITSLDTALLPSSFDKYLATGHLRQDLSRVIGCKRVNERFCITCFWQNFISLTAIVKYLQSLLETCHFLPINQYGDLLRTTGELSILPCPSLWICFLIW